MVKAPTQVSIMKYFEGADTQASAIIGRWKKNERPFGAIVALGGIGLAGWGVVSIAPAVFAAVTPVVSAILTVLAVSLTIMSLPAIYSLFRKITRSFYKATIRWKPFDEVDESRDKMWEGHALYLAKKANIKKLRNQFEELSNQTQKAAEDAKAEISLQTKKASTYQAQMEDMIAKKGEAIKETDEFEANSPYSIARIHSVYAARYYRRLGLQVYVGYLFHHESPLRKPSHVSQMIALAVQRIAEGSDEVIELGDISVEKEWTFAGDVARGIVTLVEQEAVYEATIGSGIVYSIENWLEQCFSVIGKDWHDHVRLREGFTPEYKRLISDPKTINSLGWHPVVGFPDLAKAMVTKTSKKIV